MAWRHAVRCVVAWRVVVWCGVLQCGVAPHTAPCHTKPHHAMPRHVTPHPATPHHTTHTPVVTTYQTRYSHVTHVQLPSAAYAATLALGYHHLGDFYAVGGAVRSEQDLCVCVLRGHTVRTIRDWLHQHRRTLQSLLAAPTPVGNKPPMIGHQARYALASPPRSSEAARQKPAVSGSSTNRAAQSSSPWPWRTSWPQWDGPWYSRCASSP